MKKRYEVIWEIFNKCSGNQMRDVFFEEIETDDPDAYILPEGFKGITLRLSRRTHRGRWFMKWKPTGCARECRSRRYSEDRVWRKKLALLLKESMRDLDELRVLQYSVEMAAEGHSSYEIFEILLEGIGEVDALYESGQFSSPTSSWPGTS
jgi:hypothetical protein